MNQHDRSHVEADEVRCLRFKCDITKYNRIRNERIRDLPGMNTRLEESRTGHPEVEWPRNENGGQ